MPGAYRVIISDRALADLEAIFEYIHERSPQGAASFIERVLTAIDELDSMPSRYKVVGRSRGSGLPVHSFAVQSLVIYYTVNESPSAVSILMVRHGRRRQPRRFE